MNSTDIDSHQRPSRGTRADDATLGPVSGAERLLALDVLRGLALCGVVISNMFWFSGLAFRFPAYRAELQTLSLDSLVYHAIDVLVSGKAIATLSFLFGLGFSMQLLRAQARGISAVPLHCRRLSILLLLGLGHMVFLWYGDILTLYAVLGFTLLVFARRSDRAVLLSAGILIVVFPVALGMIATIVNLGASPGAASIGPSRADVNAAALAVLHHGSYPEIIHENIAQASQFYQGLEGLSLLEYLGLFLLGLYVGRHRVFERVDAYAAVLRRVAGWGLAVGLCGNILLDIIGTVVGRRVAFSRPDLALLMHVLSIAAFAQAAGYVAAITLLLQRPVCRRWLSLFAPAGRMSLTNYLTQTVVCVSLFNGFGAGLIGRTGPALGVAIALTLYATQMTWSRLWLSRFQMGPLEWVWRSTTYSKPQPLRRSAPPRLAAASR